MILSELDNLLEPVSESENYNPIFGGSYLDTFVVTDASANGALAYAGAIAIDDRYALTKAYTYVMQGKDYSFAYSYALARNNNGFDLAVSFSFYFGC
jgi:hypothetical protein